MAAGGDAAPQPQLGAAGLQPGRCGGGGGGKAGGSARAGPRGRRSAGPRGAAEGRRPWVSP